MVTVLPRDRPPTESKNGVCTNVLPICTRVDCTFLYGQMYAGSNPRSRLGRIASTVDICEDSEDLFPKAKISARTEDRHWYTHTAAAKVMHAVP